MDKIERKCVDKSKWGWIVCLGTVITFVASVAHVNSFGLLYKDFIIDTKSTGKSVHTAHGVFSMMLAIGSVILNIMKKRYSIRKGAFMGAALVMAGSFSTIFITNANQLSITYGTLQGIGFGMIVPAYYSTLNYYFVKRRTTALSVIKALQGLAMMTTPHVINRLLFVYGFRGALLIIFGISLHTIPGIMVMKIHDKEKKRIFQTENEAEHGVKQPERNYLLNLKEQNYDARAGEHEVTKKRVIDSVLEILNIKVLKDAVFCNICFCQSFVYFSDLTFFAFQPLLLFQHGFDSMQVAASISTGAGADIAGRCILAIISSVLSVNTRALYYISIVFTLVTRLAIIQARDVTWIFVLTAALGLLRSFMHVSSSLTIANHVSHQDFTGAYAVYMLSIGIVNLICAPLIGLLKDIYQDYVPAFYALCLCCIPCLVCWPVEYIVMWNLRNK